jgi:hypothetical protein
MTIYQYTQLFPHYYPIINYDIYYSSLNLRDKMKYVMNTIALYAQTAFFVIRLWLNKYLKLTEIYQLAINIFTASFINFISKKHFANPTDVQNFRCYPYKSKNKFSNKEFGYIFCNNLFQGFVKILKKDTITDTDFLSVKNSLGKKYDFDYILRSKRILVIKSTYRDEKAYIVVTNNEFNLELLYINNIIITPNDSKWSIYVKKFISVYVSLLMKCHFHYLILN